MEWAILQAGSQIESEEALRTLKVRAPFVVVSELEAGGQTISGATPVLTVAVDRFLCAMNSKTNRPAAVKLLHTAAVSVVGGKKRVDGVIMKTACPELSGRRVHLEVIREDGVGVRFRRSNGSMQMLEVATPAAALVRKAEWWRERAMKLNGEQASEVKVQVVSNWETKPDKERAWRTIRTGKILGALFVDGQVLLRNGKPGEGLTDEAMKQIIASKRVEQTVSEWNGLVERAMELKEQADAIEVMAKTKRNEYMSFLKVLDLPAT